MYIYGTYRPKRITNPFNLYGNTSLNGTYTPSFFISNQFSDYELAGLTRIEDQVIPEENYTGEIAPGVHKLTRFISGYYNENYINGIDFANSIKAVGAEFQIDVFQSVEDARAWVRNNTNLQEVEPGKFKLSDETTGIDGEIIQAKYLEIK